MAVGNDEDFARLNSRLQDTVRSATSVERRPMTHAQSLPETPPKRTPAKAEVALSTVRSPFLPRTRVNCSARMVGSPGQVGSSKVRRSRSSGVPAGCANGVAVSHAAKRSKAPMHVTLLESDSRQSAEARRWFSADVVGRFAAVLSGASMTLMAAAAGNVATSWGSPAAASATAFTGASVIIGIILIFVEAGLLGLGLPQETQPTTLGDHSGRSRQEIPHNHFDTTTGSWSAADLEAQRYFVDSQIRRNPEGKGHSHVDARSHAGCSTRPNRYSGGKESHPLRPWMLLGGLVGTPMMLLMVELVPILGFVAFFAFMISGRIFFSCILDHFGAKFGIPVRRFSLQRHGPGLTLVVFGLACIAEGGDGAGVASEFECGPDLNNERASAKRKLLTAITHLSGNQLPMYAALGSAIFCGCLLPVQSLMNFNAGKSFQSRTPAKSSLYGTWVSMIGGAIISGALAVWLHRSGRATVATRASVATAAEFEARVADLPSVNLWIAGGLASVFIVYCQQAVSAEIGLLTFQFYSLCGQLAFSVPMDAVDPLNTARYRSGDFLVKRDADGNLFRLTDRVPCRPASPADPVESLAGEGQPGRSTACSSEHACTWMWGWRAAGLAFACIGLILHQRVLNPQQRTSRAGR